MIDNMSIDELEDFLRNFRNMAGDKFIYDFNLIFHFLAALLDNLRTNGHVGDWTEICRALDDPQREFLMQLAVYANRMTDADIDAEDQELMGDTTSQTGAEHD